MQFNAFYLEAKNAFLRYALGSCSFRSLKKKKGQSYFKNYDSLSMVYHHDFIHEKLSAGTIVFRRESGTEQSSFMIVETGGANKRFLMQILDSKLNGKSEGVKPPLISFLFVKKKTQKRSLIVKPKVLVCLSSFDVKMNGCAHRYKTRFVRPKKERSIVHTDGFECRLCRRRTMSYELSHVAHVGCACMRHRDAHA